MTAVGFEPTPLRTGAWSQRLRPLGQTVMTYRHDSLAVCVQISVPLVCLLRLLVVLLLSFVLLPPVSSSLALNSLLFGGLLLELLLVMFACFVNKNL